MIPMISLSSFTLASTLGHAVRFEATKLGSKTPNIAKVPKALVPEALARGAVVYQAEDQPIIDTEKLPNAAFAGEIRKSLIFLVMQRLVNENVAKNFTSGGVPRAEVLSTILTFDVSAKEAKGLWQEFQTAVNAGDELNLDPKAAKALDVIDAMDKGELTMLADEMNVPEAEYLGLSGKDLKQLLLSKFA